MLVEAQGIMVNPGCSVVVCTMLTLQIYIVQVEIKSSDNNWMKCYRCSFQYCHMCGEPCFGPYHFNEYGCKKSSSLKEDVKLKKLLMKDENADSGQEEEREEEGGR